MAIPDLKDPTNVDSVTIPLITESGKRTDGKIGVTAGESIINKDATEQFPHLVDALNALGMTTREKDNREVIANANVGKSIIPQRWPDPKDLKVFDSVFKDARAWPTYTQSLANIESSGGNYNAIGGTNKAYDGKYQFGKIAKEDLVLRRGKYLSEDQKKKLQHTEEGREAFRNDPELQELSVELYADLINNDLKNHPGYKNMSDARKMELIAYGHNQGPQGTKDYLDTGIDGKDGLGTLGSKYSKEVNKNLASVYKLQNYEEQYPTVPNLAQLDAAEEATTAKVMAPEVATQEPDSDMFSKLFNSLRDYAVPALETIGKGELLKGSGIPGFNTGVNGKMDIMKFMEMYTGDLSKLDPYQLTEEDMIKLIANQNNALQPTLKTDEHLLQTSSNVMGANSFEEAGRQQYNNPRLSIPIPGLAAGMTDSAQLRGGNVRPDMMPPGYEPPPEWSSTSPQGGADRIARANLQKDVYETPFPTLEMLKEKQFEDGMPDYGSGLTLNETERAYRTGQEKLFFNDPEGLIPTGPASYDQVPPQSDLLSVGSQGQLVPYPNYIDPEATVLHPLVDPNFKGKVENGMVISGDGPNATRIPIESWDPERGFVGWDPMLYATDMEGTGGGGYLQDVGGERAVNPITGTDNYIDKMISMKTGDEDPSISSFARRKQAVDLNRDLALKEQQLAEIEKNHQGLLNQAQEEIKQFGSVTQDTRALLEASTSNFEKRNVQEEIDKIKRLLERNQENQSEGSKQLRARWQAESEGNAALGLESPTFQEWLEKKFPQVSINDQTKTIVNQAGEDYKPSNENNNTEITAITDGLGGVNPQVKSYIDYQNPNFYKDIAKAYSSGTKQAQENPGLFSKAKSFLTDLFGDLFDVEELKRAAILYLGARIFGFSGNTAAAFAAKTYLTREENHNDHIRKLIQDGDYTAASIQKFKETKDESHLVKIGTPATFSGVTETWYGTDNAGKAYAITAAKMQRGKNDFFWIDQRTGKPVQKTNFMTSPIFDRTSPEGQAYEEDILKFVKDSFKSVNEATGPEGEKKRPLPYLKDPTGTANQVAVFARNNQLGLSEALEVWRIASNDAIAFQARQVKQGDTGSRVTSIKPFLHNAYVNVMNKAGNPFTENISLEMRSTVLKAGYAKILADEQFEKDYPEKFNELAANEITRDTFIIELASEEVEKLRDSTLPEDIKMLDQITKNAIGQSTTPVFEWLKLNAT